MGSLEPGLCAEDAGSDHNGCTDQVDANAHTYSYLDCYAPADGDCYTNALAYQHADPAAAARYAVPSHAAAAN